MKPFNRRNHSRLLLIHRAQIHDYLPSQTAPIHIILLSVLRPIPTDRLAKLLGTETADFRETSSRYRDVLVQVRCARIGVAQDYRSDEEAEALEESDNLRCGARLAAPAVDVVEARESGGDCVEYQR